MKRELRYAYLALAFVSFFWGTTFIAAKMSAQQMPGLFVSGVRQFISGFILVSFFLLRGYQLPTINDLKKISLQGILLLCVANGLLTWSLEYISSGLAAIIAALIPLFITLFTMWFTHCAKISKWMIAGLVIGFAGICTIFFDYATEVKNNSFVFGVALALVSTLTWAFGTVLTAKQKTSISILFNVGLQMFIAGAIMLIICLVSGKYINLATAGSEMWFPMLYLVLFGSLLAYSAYVYAISKLPATQVSIYAYINPLVAVAFGWLLLQEKLNPNMIAGTLITLAGIYVVNREFKRNSK